MAAHGLFKHTYGVTTLVSVVTNKEIQRYYAWKVIVS